jgi:hypothetical protein
MSIVVRMVGRTQIHSMGTSAIVALFINCHLERSYSIREANGVAESKDPYTTHDTRRRVRRNSVSASVLPSCG